MSHKRRGHHIDDTFRLLLVASGLASSGENQYARKNVFATPAWPPSIPTKGLLG